MNMSKYTRVKKPPANTLVTLLTSSGCIAGTQPQSKVDPLPLIANAEDETAKTFLHSTSDRIEVDLNPSSCNELIPYSGYSGRVDGKQFSSTTIVNGAAISQLQFEPTYGSDSVLVLPLDSEVPFDALMPDEDQIQTIEVGDFPELADQESSNQDVTFLSSNLLGNSCYVTVQRDWPVNSPTSMAKKTVRSLHSMKRSTLVRPGLVRFGRSRMIADTHTTISVSEYKSQLKDTSDIIGKMDLAPPTKRDMYLLNTKGVNKLFANPGRNMGTEATKLFTRHLSMNQAPVDETFDDMPLEPLGYVVPQADLAKIKRITRKRKYPEAEKFQRELFNRDMQMAYFDTVTFRTEMDDPFAHEEVMLDSQDSLLEMEAFQKRNYAQQTNDARLLAQLKVNTEQEYQPIENEPTDVMMKEGGEANEQGGYNVRNFEVMIAASEGNNAGNFDNLEEIIICQNENSEDLTEYQNESGSVYFLTSPDPLCETTIETVLTS